MGKLKETLKELSEEENITALSQGINELYEENGGFQGDLSRLKTSVSNFVDSINKAHEILNLGHGTKDDNFNANRAKTQLKNALANLHYVKEMVRKLNKEKIKFEVN